MRRIERSFLPVILLCIACSTTAARFSLSRLRSVFDKDFPSAPANAAATKRSGSGSVCPLPATGSDCFCRPIKFIPLRSVNNDRSRVTVGTIGHTHQYRVGPSYFYLSFMLGYDSSFRPGQILQNLFAADIVEACDDLTDLTLPSCSPNGRSILIQGGAYQGNNRNSRSWFADYFYLPQSFQSIISFEPSLINFLAFIDFYLGLDAALPGVYFRMYGPAVHAHWHSHFSERILEDSERLSHPAGYFTSADMPNAKLLQSFAAYANGGTPEPLDDTIDATIVFQPLNYARISRNSRSRTGFADLRFEIGWNVFQKHNYHFGFYMQGVAPTAPHRDPRYLFEPIIGNNGHWEFGGGIIGSRIVWSSRDEESHFGFYIDTNFTHMFETKEQITLELKGRPNSAYMLAQKMATNGTVYNASTQTDFLKVGYAVNEEGRDPGYQFALEYAPVANLSTVKIDTSINLKLDLIAMMNFTCGGFSFDAGYNFWLAHRHQLHRPDSGCQDECNGQALTNEPPNPLARWALKGDARVFGYEESTATPTPLSATQTKTITTPDGTCMSSIHNGCNQVGKEMPLYAGINTCGSNDENAYIDTPIDAVLFDTPLINLMNCPTPATQNQIKTSEAPKLLSSYDLDFVSTRNMSHKIFAHASFTQTRPAPFTPHVGLGGFCEFGVNNNVTPNSLIDSSKNRVDVAISQWGIWIKGGLTFSSY